MEIPSDQKNMEIPSQWDTTFILLEMNKSPKSVVVFLFFIFSIAVVAGYLKKKIIFK